MGEPYRTLLGHFRHECGHFYWDKLVRDGGKIDSCRAIFGDESENYEGALKRHYASGAPLTWQQEFVTAYATSHPGKISPRPSRITSTLSIHWRPRALLDSARGLRFPTVICFARTSISIRIAVGNQSNHRCLASAHLGDELHQSINGPARSLSVRAIAARYRQTWLYREFDPCRVKTSSLGAWREPDCVQSYSAELYS